MKRGVSSQSKKHVSSFHRALILDLFQKIPNSTLDQDKLLNFLLEKQEFLFAKYYFRQKLMVISEFGSQKPMKALPVQDRTKVIRKILF